MPDGQFVSYARVSTDRQGKSGLGLEAQRKAVADWLIGGSWDLIGEFTEVESGKHDNRPQLAEALELCRRSGATLVIAKLDRLTRNVAFLARLMESGVRFVAVDNPHASKLTIHILAAVAEDERDRISARTSAALSAAKARGTALGWAIPSRRSEQLMASMKGARARTDRAKAFALNVVPIVHSIQRAGVQTLQGIADALNARGIVTPNGYKWKPGSVHRLLSNTAEEVGAQL